MHLEPQSEWHIAEICLIPKITITIVITVHIMVVVIITVIGEKKK